MKYQKEEGIMTQVTKNMNNTNMKYVKHDIMKEKINKNEASRENVNKLFFTTVFSDLVNTVANYIKIVTASHVTEDSYEQLPVILQSTM